ncbi:hypothetical protein BJ742DRAFT_778873 [Cladochytrium replicatum]|nr:hypothetical protein BJ742DRAFT_778873 [Cladochytrium replicatum]
MTALAFSQTFGRHIQAGPFIKLTRRYCGHIFQRTQLYPTQFETSIAQQLQRSRLHRHPYPFYRDRQRVLLFLVTLALIIAAVVTASVLVKDNCHTNGRCKWQNLYLIPLGLGVLAMITAAVWVQNAWVQNAWARKWRHGQTVQVCIEKANKTNSRVVFIVVGDAEDDGGYGGMTMERLVPYEGGTTRVVHEAGGALRIEVHRKDLYT